MTIVTKTCPKCHFSDVSTNDIRGIGIPFRKCILCGNLNIDKDDNEWELMGPFAKLYYVLICVYSSFLYGFFLPIVVLLVWGKPDTFTFFILYGIGVALFAMLSVLKNRRDLTDSKERMKDPAYREQLRKMGLLGR